MRNCTVEWLRCSGAGLSTQSKSGPKARPKGVADGQLVDIPVPPYIVMTEAGTQEDSMTIRTEMYGQVTRVISS